MATVANIKVQIFSILFKLKTQNSGKKKSKKENHWARKYRTSQMLLTVGTEDPLTSRLFTH